MSIPIDPPPVARDRRIWRRIALAIGLVLLLLVAAGTTWFFMPELYRPDTVRLRMTPTGQACEAVDLELDFLKKAAIARPWAAVGTACDTPLLSLPIDEKRLEALREAAGRAANAGLLRTLVSGQPYDGSMQIVAKRADIQRTWSFRGRKTEGVVELEAFFALVVQSGTKMRPDGGATPLPTLRSTNRRRVDLQELIEPAAADAEKRAPGAWLSNLSISGLQRGGELDSTTQDMIILTFASRSSSLTYLARAGELDFLTSTPEVSERTSATSRCKSRDLWKAAIASGMPDAESAQLWLYVGNRMSGGFGPTWTLIPNGVTDRSKRRVFDGVTCGIVDP